MKRCNRLSAWLVGVVWMGYVAAQSGWGQSAPAPNLLYLNPVGGQAGSTVEVLVTGQDIDEAEGLHFSFPGAKVELGGSEITKVDPKQKGGKGMTKGGTTLTRKFKVSLPANAPPGIHDVRVVTKGGASNPRAFVVGDLPEASEKEPNNDADKPQRVELNSTINGVIANNTDVDYFQFTGKKGQRVVLSGLTTSIDSKLPISLQLYSITGNYLGSGRGYFGNDALMDATLPADGDYYVRVFGFTYTLSGPDYYYRLTISTGPWIDAVFPAAVEPGKDAKVTVWGRNLPGGKPDPTTKVDGRPLEKLITTIKAPADPLAVQRLAYLGHVPPSSAFLDGFGFTLKSPVGVSNPFLVGYAKAPVVLDEGDNDTAEKPQKIGVPCEICGLLEKKADRDWYAFAVKKGQVLGIDALGDRLGSPMDLYFLLKDEKGKTIVELDDNPDINTNQFYTRTDDPARYRFVAPADGTFHLMISSRDAFLQFGPRHIYQVRIIPEEADFRLVAMPVNPLGPDAIVVGQAGHQAYTVNAWRLNGFTGDITLTGDKLPPGVTVAPQVIPAGQKVGTLVVGAAPEAPPFTGPITVLGTAVANGKKVVREVRGATISWPVPQNNIPTIARLDRELVLSVRDKGPYAIVAVKDKVAAPMGDNVTITVKLNLLWPEFKLPVQAIPIGLPQGMVAQPVTLTPGKETKITINSKPTVPPGNFTIVLRGQTQPINLKQQQPPKTTGPNYVQTSGPIALIIMPKQLAKVSSAGNVKVAAGKSADTIIKVARLFDYDGSFKVESDVPGNAKGLKVNQAVVKAGEDEATLTVNAQNTPPGTYALTVRVIAMFYDVPVVHETKLTVNVGK